MILFLNTISNPSVFILADTNRNIIAQKNYEIKGNESSLLIEKIDDFLQENQKNYDDICDIIVVNGPGSFTGIRTIVLSVNTLAFIKNIFLTPLSYFDLFSDFPIITPSSKRDSFVKINKNSEIQILKNTQIQEDFSQMYGNNSISGIKIVENINYYDIIEKIELQKCKQIEALYIKKPNIS